MSFRRVGGLAAAALATLLWMSCGDVYRPVVIPTTITPPNPANFHAVFGISTNVPFNPGAVLQIDVSGDSNIGAANMGVNPTHAAILPNNSRVFVASAGSLYPGDADVVTAFTPASSGTTASGLGTPVTFALPYGSLPVFVNTTQDSVVYVANFGTNSVTALNTSTNAISLTGAVGANPVALVETPNGQSLYVVNQGDNTVINLSTTDLSFVATIPVGSTPVWAVSRPDGQRVYVITQGDGQLYTIRTDTNAVVSNQSVGGPGANFALYDKSLNRLYVTNPNAGSVYLFDATSSSPTLLAGISMTAGANPPCPNGCSPVSVAALPDGSRFYVASYETQAACPDPNVGTSTRCVIPRLTVFDAASLTIKPASASSSLLSPSLSLLTQPQYAATQYAVPQVSSCVPVVPYTPNSTRFPMYSTAAADGSHVYVSLCDARSIADVVTATSTIATGSNATDVLVTNLSPAFAFSAGASITSFSISNNVVTFQAANSFYAGENVVIQQLTTGTYLNGLTLTVLGTGLTESQFACAFTHADVSQTSDSGTATPASPAVHQTPVFLLTGQ